MFGFAPTVLGPLYGSSPLDLMANDFGYWTHRGQLQSTEYEMSRRIQNSDPYGAAMAEAAARRDQNIRQRIARGLTTSGTLARFRSEGKSEEFIAGYLEGRK